MHLNSGQNMGLRTNKSRMILKKIKKDFTAINNFENHNFVI